MIYFYPSYLMRLYHEDFGFRSGARFGRYGYDCLRSPRQAEVNAAFHRKYREGGFFRRLLSRVAAIHR